MRRRAALSDCQERSRLILVTDETWSVTSKICSKCRCTRAIFLARVALVSPRDAISRLPTSAINNERFYQARAPELRSERVAALSREFFLRTPGITVPHKENVIELRSIVKLIVQLIVKMRLESRRKDVSHYQILRL